MSEKNKIKIKELSELDPNKIYALRISDDTYHNMEEVDKELAAIKEKWGLRIIVLDSDMNFVSIPEGYEIKKIES